MRFGYARVSMEHESFDTQINALQEAGCEKIYQEVSSGAHAKQPALAELMGYLQPRDVIVIWRLDRIAHSVKQLIEIFNLLHTKRVDLCSICDSIDTATPHDLIYFEVFAALAKFERDRDRERTNVGLVVARAHGRIGGRPKGIPKNAEFIARGVEVLYADKNLSVREIAERLNLSKSTVYAYLRHMGVPVRKYKSRKNKSAPQPHPISDGSGSSS